MKNLFNEARRYNIKGNKYYENIKKYYSIDVGLRNASLNYRQLEQSHLMENIIFNELLYRGYAVDVGVVEHRKMVDGKSESQLSEEMRENGGFANKRKHQAIYSAPEMGAVADVVHVPFCHVPAVEQIQRSKYVTRNRDWNQIDVDAHLGLE